MCFTTSFSCLLVLVAPMALLIGFLAGRIELARQHRGFRQEARHDTFSQVSPASGPESKSHHLAPGPSLANPLLPGKSAARSSQTSTGPHAMRPVRLSTSPPPAGGTANQNPLVEILLPASDPIPVPRPRVTLQTNETPVVFRLPISWQAPMSFPPELTPRNPRSMSMVVRKGSECMPPSDEINLHDHTVAGHWHGETEDMFSGIGGQFSI